MSHATPSSGPPVTIDALAAEVELAAQLSGGDYEGASEILLLLENYALFFPYAPVPEAVVANVRQDIACLLWQNYLHGQDAATPGELLVELEMIVAARRDAPPQFADQIRAGIRLYTNKEAADTPLSQENTTDIRRYLVGLFTGITLD